MANLSSVEKQRFEILFGMKSGYVLDFSNNTYDDFIKTSTGIDINDSKYNRASGSKANRLRAFWEIEPNDIVGSLLSDMLEYWKMLKNGEININEKDQSIYNECVKSLNRLKGKTTEMTGQDEFTEDGFLKKEFQELNLDKLGLDSIITGVIKQRLEEIKNCLNAKAPLAVIFLCGSTLEGILLGMASSKPVEFNQSPISPKDENGKVLKFQYWTLNNFIDVSHSIGLIDVDVKKFSHSLRDFRNYIHPFQQVSSNFNPDEHTAKICWQVLKAAIYQLSK